MVTSLRRDTRIRTWDPLLPKQVRYRAALHPEKLQLTADRPGFEPGAQGYPCVGLANRWFQPLTHLSKLGRKDITTDTFSQSQTEKIF
jgi:hypothetical protein